MNVDCVSNSAEKKKAYKPYRDQVYIFSLISALIVSTIYALNGAQPTSTFAERPLGLLHFALLPPRPFKCPVRCYTRAK